MIPHTDKPVTLGGNQSGWTLYFGTPDKFGRTIPLATVTGILVDGSGTRTPNGDRAYVDGVMVERDQREVDAHRLALCWNACQALTNEELSDRAALAAA